MVLGRVALLAGKAVVPLVAGLPPPGRMLRMAAWAPTLMRRANGVVGVRVKSSSSTAFSSDVLVDMLARLMKPAELGVGDVPGTPAVDTDSLRRWSFKAAVVMGPGKPVPCETELPRNMLVKAAEVTEPRRVACRFMSLGLVLLLLLLLLSEDMVMKWSRPGQANICAWTILLSEA